LSDTTAGMVSRLVARDRGRHLAIVLGLRRMNATATTWRLIPWLGLLASLVLLAACAGDTGQKQSLLIPEQQVPGSRVPDRPQTAVAA
jgi:hypothetical protein